MVVGDGTKYDDAYFEVNYVRAYTTGAAPTPTGTSGSSSSAASGAQVSTTSTSGSSGSTNTSGAGPVASGLRLGDLMVLCGMMIGGVMVGML